jgi:hypothetical protein
MFGYRGNVFRMREPSAENGLASQSNTLKVLSLELNQGMTLQMPYAAGGVFSTADAASATSHRAGLDRYMDTNGCA